MVSFGTFARIASIIVGFHLSTLHDFFQSDFWPNLNFLLEHQIKLVLTSILIFLHIEVTLIKKSN